MMKTKLLILAAIITLIQGMKNSGYSQTDSGPAIDLIPSPTQAEATKYGALAIDRTNGFYFAWAVDSPTQAEAEKKAVAECNAKGGKCTVVLSFSGTCCAAYRTSAGKSIGLAFGWGVAKTKEEADVIAKREHLLRSFGMAAPNVSYGCNGANSGTLKSIYNATAEIQSLPGDEEDY